LAQALLRAMARKCSASELMENPYLLTIWANRKIAHSEATG
jgi:hypothetical protein